MFKWFVNNKTFYLDVKRTINSTTISDIDPEFYLSLQDLKNTYPENFKADFNNLSNLRY